MDWGTIFGSVQSDILSAVTAVLPVALGVFALILGIRVAIRTFRGVAGR